jgi:acyl-coenzyme A thioesterase PaaI-like protein
LTVSHHELCFGCGLANLFGLQLELERDGDRVAGRFFAKQDHQGPDGNVHKGILVTAIEEALSLAGGEPATLEVEFIAPASIGTFLSVSASKSEAELRSGGELVARAMAKRADPG